MKKRYIVLIVVGVIFVAMMGHGMYCNTALELNEYEVSSEKIPDGFDGFRIAQISDLHNAEFGEDNEKLLSLLKDANADIIVITGDMVDSRRTDLSVALDFAEQAVKLGAVYYVNGNHESRIKEYDDLKKGLIACGVIVLENETVTLSRENDLITLCGLVDPAFPMDKYVDDTMAQNVSHQLFSMLADNDNYKILLAHRPEYLESYAGQVDLVFSGHAHGGQINLPFVGGLIAPNQGFFPAYYEGIYEQNGTKMVVSRGVGNSLFPLRINNPPEIVIVELHSE